MTEDSPRTSLEKQPTAERSPAPAPAPAPVAEAEVRASDADRDRVADILREALAEGRLDAEEHSERVEAVYAAKTVGELEPIVRDLPAGRREASGEYGYGARERGVASGSYSSGFATFSAAHTSGPPVPGYGPKENLVAIFSGTERKGRWRVPRKINAFACFGGIVIDLTEALFEHQHVQINATAIFGGIEIRVPENVTLQQKGAGIFGGFDVQVTDSPDPDAPVVLVEGAAVFGGVDAKPKRGKVIENLRERFRKQL
ncbi:MULTISPECIES: DUF1707 domain-containing protein [unclassified Streptomyces]|uniref:DUF1707 SHOCT-like domain-containing protein n=1 Tax=unclassified Streptomyces TaxID=2593676 RepID=UPI002DD90A7B|nr:MULTISPECIES: DUF1707 domain-containing protein [unclassified Streptomyces]WSA92630.1 DUF1707 domain-containing protein [Streptomyces sp. NBC_01795]WSB76996.1 DUF1707 domain-containing protein [Streptomyces sp. NBC_01775]WSS14733.1 DUF1707 domain-containing protein [Streptomyces sp. NBC_01186]WSS43562.1 DUF1707 domain-containing protein [Streptomyces sp. NBC_01187]